MNALRVVAITLLVAGVLALVYGGFSYTRQTQTAEVGPIALSLSETRRINVPLWAGVAAVVAGGALLLSGGRRS